MYVNLANTVVIIFFACIGFVVVHNAYLLLSISRVTRAFRKHDPRAFYIPDQALLKQPLVRISLPQYIINIAIRLRQRRDKRRHGGGGKGSDAMQLCAAPNLPSTKQATTQDGTSASTPIAIARDSASSIRDNAQVSTTFIRAESSNTLTAYDKKDALSDEQHSTGHASVVFSSHLPVHANHHKDDDASCPDGGDDSVCFANDRHDHNSACVQVLEVEKEVHDDSRAAHRQPRHDDLHDTRHRRPEMDRSLCATPSLQDDHHHRADDEDNDNNNCSGTNRMGRGKDSNASDTQAGPSDAQCSQHSKTETKDTDTVGSALWHELWGGALSVQEIANRVRGAHAPQKSVAWGLTLPLQLGPTSSPTVELLSTADASRCADCRATDMPTHDQQTAELHARTDTPKATGLSVSTQLTWLLTHTVLSSAMQSQTQLEEEGNGEGCPAEPKVHDAKLLARARTDCATTVPGDCAESESDLEGQKMSLGHSCVPQNRQQEQEQAISYTHSTRPPKLDDTDGAQLQQCAHAVPWTSADKTLRANPAIATADTNTSDIDESITAAARAQMAQLRLTFILGADLVHLLRAISVKAHQYTFPPSSFLSTSAHATSTHQNVCNHTPHTSYPQRSSTDTGMRAESAPGLARSSTVTVEAAGVHAVCFYTLADWTRDNALSASNRHGAPPRTSAFPSSMLGIHASVTATTGATPSCIPSSSALQASSTCSTSSFLLSSVSRVQRLSCRAALHLTSAQATSLDSHIDHPEQAKPTTESRCEEDGMSYTLRWHDKHAPHKSHTSQTTAHSSHTNTHAPASTWRRLCAWVQRVYNATNKTWKRKKAPQAPIAYRAAVHDHEEHLIRDGEAMAQVMRHVLHRVCAIRSFPHLHCRKPRSCGLNRRHRCECVGDCGADAAATVGFVSRPGGTETMISRCSPDISSNDTMHELLRLTHRTPQMASADYHSGDDADGLDTQSIKDTMTRTSISSGSPTKTYTAPFPGTRKLFPEKSHATRGASTSGEQLPVAVAVYAPCVLPNAASNGVVLLYVATPADVRNAVQRVWRTHGLRACPHRRSAAAAGAAAPASLSHAFRSSSRRHRVRRLPSPLSTTIDVNNLPLSFSSSSYRSTLLYQDTERVGENVHKMRTDVYVSSANSACCTPLSQTTLPTSPTQQSQETANMPSSNHNRKLNKHHRHRRKSSDRLVDGDTNVAFLPVSGMLHQAVDCAATLLSEDARVTFHADTTTPHSLHAATPVSLNACPVSFSPLSRSLSLSSMHPPAVIAEVAEDAVRVAALQANPHVVARQQACVSHTDPNDTTDMTCRAHEHQGQQMQSCGNTNNFGTDNSVPVVNTNIVMNTSILCTMNDTKKSDNDAGASRIMLSQPGGGEVAAELATGEAVARNATLSDQEQQQQRDENDDIRKGSYTVNDVHTSRRVPFSDTASSSAEVHVPVTLRYIRVGDDIYRLTPVQDSTIVQYCEARALHKSESKLRKIDGVAGNDSRNHLARDHIVPDSTISRASAEREEPASSSCTYVRQSTRPVAADTHQRGAESRYERDCAEYSDTDGRDGNDTRYLSGRNVTGTAVVGGDEKRMSRRRRQHARPSRATSSSVAMRSFGLMTYSFCDSPTAETTRGVSAGERGEFVQTRRKAVNMCWYCFSQEASVIFVPCAHFAVCAVCANTMTNCCVCKTKIDSAIVLHAAAAPTTTHR